MSISQSSNINPFRVENELVEICKYLRSPDSDSKKVKLPSEVKSKIFYYQWKVLGKNSQNDRFGEFAFLNLENHSCSNLEKIDAIEKFLIHSVKKQLALIAKDFEQDKETEAYSALSQVYAFSKKVEILKDLENDLYFQMWKVIGRPSNLPGIGELTFKEPSENYQADGNYFKSQAINRYVKVLPLLSSLKSSEKTDALCLNLFREKTGIEIQGSKVFRKFIAADIKKLLTCDIGRELFSYVESRSDRNSINIVRGEEAQVIRFFPHYIEMPDNDDCQKIYISSEDNEIELCNEPSYISLAHELAHCHLSLNRLDCLDERSTNPLLYSNLEEEIVITGKMKNGEQYKFSENEFRKRFHYPMRVSHYGLIKNSFGSPLHESCYSGSLKNTENYLRQGINANITVSDGITPLHFLCASFFLFENPNKFKGVIDLLLENGADIHKKNSNGFSPIFQLGMNIFFRLQEKRIENKKCIFEVYKYLIEKGADPFAKEDNNCPQYSSIDSRLRYELKCLNEDDLILQLDGERLKICMKNIKNKLASYVRHRIFLADYKSLEELNRELQDSPGVIQARLPRAFLYMKHGDFSSAIKDCEYVLEEYPANSIAQALLKRCLDLLARKTL